MNNENTSDQPYLGEHEEPSQGYVASRGSPNTYTFRIERAVCPVPDMYANRMADKTCYLVPDEVSIEDIALQKNWYRDFTVLGRHTLEQLNEIILHILGWDQQHLYEFKIAERVYAHLIFLEEDDLFVDVRTPCVSCNIPIRLLDLSVGDIFSYKIDFGDYHVFRISVLDIRPTIRTEVVPALLSYQGRNVIQYPGCMGKSKARAFMYRAPVVTRPQPTRDRFRIRFIREADGSLLREWRASNNKKYWQKAVTILESRNMSPENIAQKIERDQSIVEKWIITFNRYGLEGLKKPDGYKGPIPSRERNSREAARAQKARRILEIMHAKPSAYGVNRTSWSLSAIKRIYQQEHNETIGKGSVAELISGYGIRKARKVLTSPDPNYREKVELLLQTLQTLKPRELFFFIDELGPLHVKKYGGRALVRKNEVLAYPQEQAHRGVIMMSGALSATTNQVTWIYGRAKDTAAMIDLIELLYNQYFSASKLYVTWDAASWHKSTMLIEWLDTFNYDTDIAGEGPLIELVPLPTSSQFLDVIEAVFSGMKRAVIHHSDYRDVTEMKGAISLHFTERNNHFRENPRRVGKQIWEIDFFDDNTNIRSGNYREW